MKKKKAFKALVVVLAYQSSMGLVLFRHGSEGQAGEGRPGHLRWGGKPGKRGGGFMVRILRLPIRVVVVEDTRCCARSQGNPNCGYASKTSCVCQRHFLPCRTGDRELATSYLCCKISPGL